MTQFIINQDRTQIYRFEPEAFIYCCPVNHNGVCFGINLMMGSKFLGTFDSPKLAIDEVTAIYSSKSEVYLVNGFSDWKGE